jgi:hypothetical protein
VILQLGILILIHHFIVLNYFLVLLFLIIIPATLTLLALFVLIILPKRDNHHRQNGHKDILRESENWRRRRGSLAGRLGRYVG